MNVNDTEIARAVLKNAGYEETFQANEVGTFIYGTECL